MKKRIIGLSLALAAGSAGHACAQGASDALQYSRLQFGGPARTLGIGGANVALGADFGNLSSNPAGLGLFQKSEIHFTPGFGVGRSEARLEGSGAAAQNEEKNSFHVGSAGLVLANRRPDSDQSTNWRGGAFAVGFTRLADFNSASRYQGTVGNNQSYLSSLQPDADAARSQGDFADLDKQFDNNDFTSSLGLAYGAYLANIITDNTGKDAGVRLRRQGSLLTQSELVVNKGSASQLDLGYGSSYRDRLYIGGAIGIVSSNYTQERTLTEADADPNTYFTSLLSESTLTTKGTGINARLGLIYRASDVVRVGASVQTPTFMRLTDSFSESLTSDFSEQGNETIPDDLPIGETRVRASYPDFTYNLTTPFRANGGVAVTLGKYGFVTGDVEYVGYGQARLHTDVANATDDANFARANTNIQDRYQSAVNLRFGAEGRFAVFRARLGFARYGDPYKADTNSERAQNFYTGGLGVRQGNFFLDAAAVYTSVDKLSSPYQLENGLQPVIMNSSNRFTTSLTAGVTF